MVRHQIACAFKENRALVLVQEHGLSRGSSHDDASKRMGHEATHICTEPHEIHVSRYGVEGCRTGYEDA